MEEDIKILENVLETKEYGLCEITDTFYKAIENLLKRYKELEEENKKLVKANDNLKTTKRIKTYKEIEKYFIPTSVIQKKIDEYREKRNNLADGHFWDNKRNINEDTSLFIAIETLKLLLEERNK